MSTKRERLRTDLKNAEDINKETVGTNDRITSNTESKLLIQHDYKIRPAGHLGFHI